VFIGEDKSVPPAWGRVVGGIGMAVSQGFRDDVVDQLGQLGLVAAFLKAWRAEAKNRLSSKLSRTKRWIKSTGADDSCSNQTVSGACADNVAQ